MAKKVMLEKHKDVARIDQEDKRTHGWYVRVRFQGTTHSKFFSDGKCGGRYSSLLAALTWRDTTTGVVGVRFNEKLNRYEVSWVNRVGKQGKTSVSVNKNGKERAFQIACEIRKAKEAERLSA